MQTAQFGIDTGKPDPDHVALQRSIRRLLSNGASVHSIIGTVVFSITYFPPDEINFDSPLTAHNGLAKELAVRFVLGSLWERFGDSLG